MKIETSFVEKKKSNYLYKTVLLVFLVCFSKNLYAQKITKGPYLAEPKANSIVVRWESDSLLAFNVGYGITKKLSNIKLPSLLGKINKRYLFEVKLSNLISGERYYYQVISDTIKSRISYFNTDVNENNPFTFVVTGDSRSHPKIFAEIAKHINQDEPNLIISVGDLVRNGGVFEQWGKYFFNVADNVINHIPFIPSVGDHEAGEDDGDEGKLFAHFFFPHKNYKKLWFSYNYGNAHFVVLDFRYPYNKEMIEWFKKDMTKSKMTWNFVYMHRPCYNLGGHRSAWGREIWPELFTEYNVDIVFAGHSHLYERFFPVRPTAKPNAKAVTYITTGGSGASLYDIGKSTFLAYTKSIHHYIVVKTVDNNIELKVFKKDGTILDEISWNKNSKKFDNLVKSQDELDIIGMFTNTISHQIERLPMAEMPAEYLLELKPLYYKDDITFEISLTDKSKLSYNMETVKDTLKNGEPKNIKLKIFAKGDMIVSKWGEIKPKLKLKVQYKSSDFNGSITGSEIEYKSYNYSLPKY